MQKPFLNSYPTSYRYIHEAIIHRAVAVYPPLSASVIISQHDGVLPLDSGENSTAGLPGSKGRLSSLAGCLVRLRMRLISFARSWNLEKCFGSSFGCMTMRALAFRSDVSCLMSGLLVRFSLHRRQSRSSCRFIHDFAK